MDPLDALESQSITILREAYRAFSKPCMLWSVGKDSTAVLWLTFKAFLGHCPFPVVHVDTSYKIPAMIDFRDRMARHWGLRLIVVTHQEALDAGMNAERGRMNCCGALKTDGLKLALARHGFDGVIVGIRADEEGTRAKERVFSPRGEAAGWNAADQPPEFWDIWACKAPPGGHVRVHPLLDWKEIDIWNYVRREGIPLPDLYFDRGDGRRYRSLGCAPCTLPIPSTAKNVDDIIAELGKTKIAERAGRAQDADRGMEKLRKAGYM